ncbi:NAD(P)H-dependent oxidoreductase [Granulicatella seriolae]|uniref:NAD(P)H-dependent oxidoreductase n=1 Tax=Granulicatella seriolae TaxID=2967226 RepID=A0ABT1WNR2_9LACT|nr:NAD(P)H-dependent oxidoreductase [Granulicatella seriolae]
MRTLVIISHPSIDESASQQFLLACGKGRKSLTVRHLDRLVGGPLDRFFDKEVELDFLRQADRIIFQFPLYWYSCPGSLKLWMDQVLDLSGSLANKEFGIVLTLGLPASHFQIGGREVYSISELLRPFQALAHKQGWRFLPPLAIHQFDYMTEQEKQGLAIDYQRYLSQESFDQFHSKEKWFIEEAERLATSQNSTISKEKWLQLATWMADLQDERVELRELVDNLREEF